LDEIEEHSSCKDTVKMSEQQDFSFFKEGAPHLPNKYLKNGEEYYKGQGGNLHLIGVS
jgi:hypothetical protein